MKQYLIGAAVTIALIIIIKKVPAVNNMLGL